MIRIYFITALLLLLSTSIVSSEESNPFHLNLTKDQKDLATIIKSNEQVIDAKWINSYTLLVVNNPKELGDLDKSTAELQAELFAELGKAYIGKNVCVKITEPKRGEIAYKCEGDHTES